MKGEEIDARRAKVNDLIAHPGWSYVEEYIDFRLRKCGDIRKIPVEGKTDQEILREVFLRKVESDTLVELRNYIKNITQENKLCQKQKEPK